MKTIILILLLSAICMAVSPLGQDPVKASPKLYKLLLDNDQVRVLEFRLKPDQNELGLVMAKLCSYCLYGTRLGSRNHR